ncbi:uncharacterized protein LOC114526426 [Dendronephthya gigantea]|uniref:uncharacterized protein LOC114526426 n=1 Tax=Dendronephthya gigantea TaxID=151771 RepID=UPI00106ACD9C|nr:uncharacterized protein LOC114526426 [Dendronephthya gigantea]
MSEYNIIPKEEREMEERQTAPDTALKPELPKLDKNDWKKVKDKAESGMSESRAVDEVKADKLIEQSKEPGGIDPLLVIMRDWPKLPEYEAQPAQLEHFISRLTEIILKVKIKEKKSYEYFVDETDPLEPSLLHLAAKHNFVEVSKILVEHWPSLVTSRLRIGNAYPVEIALEEHYDDTAAYLISKMMWDQIQDLFLCDEDKEPLKRSFGHYISYESGMKKTVIEILNKLIDPIWPYLPNRKEQKNDDYQEQIQRALISVPNNPLKYDFYYHILETDEEGRVPRILVKVKSDEADERGSEASNLLEKVKWKDNRRFNKKSVSCLQRLSESDNKEAVQHPVVRMLVAKKWNEFAHPLYCIRAGLYLLFLAVLSFALVYGSTRDDPTQYEGAADTIRAFCEICSIVFLMVDLFVEIREVARANYIQNKLYGERKSYFKVFRNYIDFIGIILTLLIIPLRYAEVASQWVVAAIAFIFNFIRLFKYCYVTRITGLYTTTLVTIIWEDITRFLGFFSVIFIGFCGAMYMALKVNNVQDSYSFPWLMLGGIKALVEGESLEEEDGKKFSWLAVLILLAYMGIVVVILLNILIAQLSYTYGKAKKMARLQYAADTMRIVARMENSPFARLNYRVKAYEEGEIMTDEKLAKEILEFTEDRHPWETDEERITSVREAMRRVIKGEEDDPLETIDEKITHLTEIVENLKTSKGNRLLYLHI